MTIDELLDFMDELVADSTGLPFGGGKRVVDVDRLQDALDELRLILPDEVRQARAIVNDRADIVAAAKREAVAIVKRAEERARILVSEQEIVKEAQHKGAEIISAAQSQARDMRTTVTEYCERMLKITEEQMAKNAAEVKTLRANLRQTAKNGGKMS